MVWVETAADRRKNRRCQTEFARKAFEAATQHTRDVADLVQTSSAEAIKIIQDRLRESLEEIRGSVDPKK